MVLRSPNIIFRLFPVKFSILDLRSIVWPNLAIFRVSDFLDTGHQGIASIDLSVLLLSEEARLVNGVLICSAFLHFTF